MKPRFRGLKLIDEVREYNLGLWSWLWLQDNVVPKVFLTEVINYKHLKDVSKCFEWQKPFERNL